jgi:phosphoribosylanthranilate isomerase
MVTPVALVRLQGGAVPDELLELLGQFWVSHIQVYGDFESRKLAILRRDGFRPIPVVSVRDGGFADQAAFWWAKGGEPSAAAVVLDAYDPGRDGGTGSRFRWEWVSAARQAGRLEGWPPIILAGGLRPENVTEAIRVARPYAVDVSSGVEIEGPPGRKDPSRMRAFVRAARAAFADAPA